MQLRTETKDAHTFSYFNKVIEELGLCAFKPKFAHTLCAFKHFLLEKMKIKGTSGWGSVSNGTLRWRQAGALTLHHGRAYTAPWYKAVREKAYKAQQVRTNIGIVII